MSRIVESHTSFHAPSSSPSIGFTDCSLVDMLSVQYNFVNFELLKRLVSANW
jgi:hypothetical protein